MKTDSATASAASSSRLSVTNRLAELRRVSAWIEAWGVAQDLGEEDRFRLDLVLAELVSNIIQYGYAEEGGEEIVLSIERDGERLVLECEDGGRSFDPFGGEEKVLPGRLEEAEIGGLGIHLIRRYADTCRYVREGGRNRSVLTFRVQAASHA